MISVVIPLYNKEHTILHTLHTVMAQTYQNFEVIIVDDGSKDNSVQKILENFTDSRIHIIHQDNAGVSAARNTGICNAKGNWIAFLDADDEWSPVYLQTVIDSIANHNEIDLFLTGRYSQNILTHKVTSSVPRKYEGQIKEINFFDNPHVFFHITATVVRASLLQQNINTWGSFVEGQKSNEDFTFIFRVALHCRCLYIGIPLTIYNGGIDGQATSILKKEQKMKDNILFRNLVMAEWYSTGKQNKTCGTFMLYEFRHAILAHLRSKDFIGLKVLIDGMTRDVRTHFVGPLTSVIINNKPLYKLGTCYILFTKLIWRMHGYPVVGK